MTNSLAFHLEVLSALPKTVGDIALGTRMRTKFQILCLMKKLLKRVLLWPQPPWQNQWFLIQLGLMHSLGRNLVVMLVWKLFLVPTRNKVLHLSHSRLSKWRHHCRQAVMRPLKNPRNPNHLQALGEEVMSLILMTQLLMWLGQGDVTQTILSFLVSISPLTFFLKLVGIKPLEYYILWGNSLSLRCRRYFTPKADGALKCTPEALKLWGTKAGRD